MEATVLLEDYIFLNSRGNIPVLPSLLQLFYKYLDNTESVRCFSFKWLTIQTKLAPVEKELVGGFQAGLASGFKAGCSLDFSHLTLVSTLPSGQRRFSFSFIFFQFQLQQERVELSAPWVETHKKALSFIPLVLLQVLPYLGCLGGGAEGKTLYPNLGLNYVLYWGFPGA